MYLKLDDYSESKRNYYQKHGIVRKILIDTMSRRKVNIAETDKGWNLLSKNIYFGSNIS